VLHGDNGPSVKATTVSAMLHWLGIAPSHSRPRVSGDCETIGAARGVWFCQLSRQT